MSAIGPRPLIPGELEAHGGRPLYNKVKPGLTGWWGCNGRSDIEYQERLELEYYYITHCSLYLDALCILRTAPRRLQARRGAVSVPLASRAFPARPRSRRQLFEHAKTPKKSSRHLR